MATYYKDTKSGEIVEMVSAGTMKLTTDFDIVIYIDSAGKHIARFDSNFYSRFKKLKDSEMGEYYTQCQKQGILIK